MGIQSLKEGRTRDRSRIWATPPAALFRGGNASEDSLSATATKEMVSVRAFGGLRLLGRNRIFTIEYHWWWTVENGCTWESLNQYPSFYPQTCKCGAISSHRGKCISEHITRSSASSRSICEIVHNPIAVLFASPVRRREISLSSTSALRLHSKCCNDKLKCCVTRRLFLPLDTLHLYQSRSPISSPSRAGWKWRLLMCPDVHR
jgi:hypothetical protein